MSENVTLPALGESVSEATVTKWLKRIGDIVIEGEPLVDVSTDKVDTEVLAPFTGVLTEILVAEDVTVDVGTVIAVIGESTDAALPFTTPDAEPSVAPVASAVAPPAPPAKPAPVEGVHAQPLRAEPGRGPYLTLLVRKAVKERNLDVSTVVGTGIGGRIRFADLPADRAASRLRRSDSTPDPGSPLTMTMEWDISALRPHDDPARSLQPLYAAALRAGVRAVPSVSVGDVHLVVGPDDGYLSATAEIIAPGVAALCVGAPRQVPRVVMIGGQAAISVGWVVMATLAYDGRAVGSDDALRVLTAVRTSLSEAGSPS